jgi:hypothetical protein
VDRDRSRSFNNLNKYGKCSVSERVVLVVEYLQEKRAWILTSTWLPEKLGLLARFLVETMALTKQK